jgi:Tol biopolymer transport system component
MELTTTRPAVPDVPWRIIAAFALVLLLVASLILYAGSRTRVPSPFGIARNGVVALDRQNDLYVVDPVSGSERLLVGGPAKDEWIDFTRDGTRALFVRWTDDSGSQVHPGRPGVADVATGALTFLPLTIRRQDWMESSPDRRTLAVMSLVDGSPRISIVGLDGSSLRTFDDVPVADGSSLAFLAPEGRELVFVTPPDGTRHQGIAALDVATGKARTIVPASARTEVFGGVSAAPDGKRIAYALQDLVSGAVSVHVIGTDGQGDQVAGHADGATFEAWPQWSPSGRYLLIERGIANVARPVIVDMQDGSEVLVKAEISNNGAGKAWAPDETSILAQRTDADGTQAQQEQWDVRSGEVTPVIWRSVSAPVWQRLAP